MITIVLADDHLMVRKGFRMLLDTQPDFKVVGEAPDADGAFELVREKAPDVLLCDISMGTGQSGLLLVERLVASACATRVVVLTMHDSIDYLKQAMELGASGFILKSSSNEELFKAIRFAAADQHYVCEGMMDSFIKMSLSKETPETQSLPPREAEIVALAVQGYSNSEIASRLSISVKTVESQKARIMRKLGMESRSELFTYAVKHGLIKI